MNYLKKIGISTLYTISLILILTIILTIFNYFGLISTGISSIFEILIPSISFFIGGFQIGKRSKQKGWLEGIKFSGVLFLIFILLNLILRNNLAIRYILYYIILMSLSTLGSIIGINKNSSN